MGKLANKKVLTIVIIAAAVLVLAGLAIFVFKPVSESPAVPSATAVEATAAVIQPTATEFPPTATAIPSPTPTQLPSPTAIPPLAVNDAGMTVWCYPVDQVIAPPASDGLANAPENANLSAIEGDMVLVTIPNYSCNYVFRFNQKAPEGLKLEVYDWLQKQPVFNLALQPASDDANAAVAVSKNAYLTSPPVWEYTYRFILKDASGAELWNKQVHLDKGWRPNICLAGVLPNPKTLRCPLRQDSHPWDPWYGKTPVPNDDDHPIP